MDVTVSHVTSSKRSAHSRNVQPATCDLPSNRIPYDCHRGLPLGYPTQLHSYNLSRSEHAPKEAERRFLLQQG